jgi:nucleotidyltransferase/DNA polymerase involved in DNA repair
MIVCVRIPAFGSVIEERDNPRLHGKPFILVDPNGPAQIISGVSIDALSSGVRIGMTLRQVQAICPAAQVVAANPARAHRAADDLMEALAGFTDLVEMEVPPYRPPRSRRLQPAIGANEGDGVWFMNPGRMRGEQAVELANTLQETILERTCLDSAIGLAANRFTARVAAASLMPRQAFLVPRDSEREFLAPYPAALLPVYAEQMRQLHMLGIDTLGTLAGLPTSALNDLFGKQGAAFKRLAEGRDTTPVLRYVPHKAERAVQQLNDPVDDRGVLVNVIGALTMGLAQTIQERGQLACALMLMMTLADGGNQVTEIALRQPSASADHLTRILAEMLDGLRLNDSVAGIEVTLDGIVEVEARQLSMFPTESVPQDQLREVLHYLVARQGAEKFFLAEIIAPNALLPEHRFRLRQVEAA